MSEIIYSLVDVVWLELDFNKPTISPAIPDSTIIVPNIDNVAQSGEQGKRPQSLLLRHYMTLMVVIEHKRQTFLTSALHFSIYQKHALFSLDFVVHASAQ
jgi:hypothetical protein